MLQHHLDWILSLHLEHAEFKATHTEQFNWRTKREQALTGNNTAPATPLDLAGQRSEMDDNICPNVIMKPSS